MIQEYKFRVEREAEESKRKQIEADGIAAFQRTVSQGISESYLRWRGIEATLALAQSQNSKIVVIGSGKDGLPIILGNVDTPVSPGTAPQPGAGDTALPSGAAAPPPPASATQTPPGPAPSGGGGAGAPSQRGSPSGSAEPAPGSNSTADASAAPPDSNAAPNSPSPLDIPAVKAILSRISGALQSTGSDTNTGAKPSH